MTKPTEVLNKIELNGNRVATTLNLSDNFRKLIINNAKDQIRIFEAQKEAMLPAYESERAAFLALEKQFREKETQWNNLNHVIAEQKQLINVMITHKDAKMQVNDELTSRQVYEGKRIPWTKEVKAVLEREHRFMSGGEIFDAIVKLPDIRSIILKSKMPVRSVILSNFKVHAELAAKNPKSKKLLFREYKGKYGLKEWFRKDGIPSDPKFMKEFVYDDDNKAALREMERELVTA